MFKTQDLNCLNNLKCSTGYRTSTGAAKIDLGGWPRVDVGVGRGDFDILSKWSIAAFKINCFLGVVVGWDGELAGNIRGLPAPPPWLLLPVFYDLLCCVQYSMLKIILF